MVSTAGAVHPSLPVCVLWNLMVRSAVPPPVASRLLWKGHQASAFTAAWWAVMRWVGRSLAASQIISRLSLPPLASCRPGREGQGGIWHQCCSRGDLLRVGCMLVVDLCWCFLG